MGRYIVRRSLWVVVLLLIISVVTFGIFYILPSDPAALSAGKNSSPEEIALIEKKLGLDKPVFLATDSQFVTYLKGVVVGRDIGGNDCPPPCFGYSFKNELPVFETIKDRLPVTFSVTIGAAVLWLLMGVSVGIISALKKGTVVDRAAMMTSLAGVSLPIIFTGYIALLVLVYKLRWFPQPRYNDFTESPVKWATGLILPWIALAFLNSAIYARLVRANMLETMAEDYVRTARAKGLPERTVVRRHGLRAALTPIITVFGLDLGQLLGGAVLTETVFSINGLGKLAINAVSNTDLPIITGVTVFSAFFIVLANLIVDVLYAVVDPRVRYS
ncbi:MAG TPA: ABC transporter permease [Mycobacteriales bacterium]|nr:ABC transporter permease [Mycobacteriales bacterium]